MIDQLGRQIYSDWDIVDELLKNTNLDLSHAVFFGSDRYNQSVLENYSEFDLVSQIDAVDCELFHQQQQVQWLMPEEYQNLDIAEYLISLCETTVELDRVADELLLYQDQNLFGLLKYLKYLVDVMQEHNIVYGVGRGSSCSSYVLYLLKVHQIDSIKYELDVREFLRG
jgi:DNA polymerase III alpha subunit